jgi:hypothetical protein
MPRKIRVPRKILFGEEEQMRLPTHTYHLNFDGANDKIIVPQAASINNLPLADFTVDFSAAIPQNNTGYIIEKTSSFFEGWEIYTYGNSSLGTYFTVTGDDYGAYVVAFFDLPANGATHHYEMAWKQATQTIKVFIDGAEVTYRSNGNGGDPISVYDDDSATNILIGNHTEAGLNPLDFNLSWLRISNIVRHTSNFTPPSLTTCPAADAHTVLRLALDEGSGTTATDTSGNNNNGTISGATWEVD